MSDHLERQANTTARIVAEVSRTGEVRRVLWWHLTDRWYFGDFLRHAPWLPWLRATFPAAATDVATHPDYLPLLATDGYADLVDARGVAPTSLTAYDLVVIPGATQRTMPRIERGISLSTWDSGWALHVDGVLRLNGVKDEINYFRAASPVAITEQPADSPHLMIVPGLDELATVRRALDQVFPDGEPIVVVNPTSSNPFTRETAAPKEVDNALTARDHVRVLRRLLELLPGHAFVVGAARKPHDAGNAAVAREVAERCAGPRVSLLADLPVPAVESLHGFAGVLASPRVCCTIGGGTGTNAHLAALTGTFGFSIEHGADAEMIGNWANPQEFQMGSFRWRNPSPLAGSHTLDWSRRTDQALTAAVDAFTCHHALAHGAWANLFTDPAAAREVAATFTLTWPHQPRPALLLAQRLLGAMTPAARAHYGDFTDEAAYLRLKQGAADGIADHDGEAGEGGLAAIPAMLAVSGPANLGARLFEHSNLHKVLEFIGSGDRGGSPGPTRERAPVRLWESPR